MNFECAAIFQSYGRLSYFGLCTHFAVGKYGVSWFGATSSYINGHESFEEVLSCKRSGWKLESLARQWWQWKHKLCAQKISAAIVRTVGCEYLGGENPYLTCYHMLGRGVWER